MSPFSNLLTAFELEEFSPDGDGGQADRDLDGEDRERVESHLQAEVATPGCW
jgi:hypothetical protein